MASASKHKPEAATTPSTDPPDIVVVVVTYNGQPWIGECLRSLRGHAIGVRAIVVDNASTDGTAALVEGDFPEVELVRLARNVGFGSGNNVGIARAMELEARYTLLLNQDAYVLPDTLKEMADFMDAHQEYGVCSPLHCSPDENALDARTFRNYLAKNAHEYLSDLVMGRARAYYTIHGVNAAVWFFRTSTFETLGGFDPLFFMYGEDDDMLSRMAFHKVKFALLTRIRVVHQRQSPPSAAVDWLARLQRDTRRRYASLLKEIKLPQNSITFMAALLVSRGLLRPLADVIVDRRLDLFVATLLATARVLLRLPAVLKGARTTRQRGCHYISQIKEYTKGH